MIRAIRFRVPFLIGGLNLGEGAASSVSSFGAATVRVCMCMLVCAYLRASSCCMCVRVRLCGRLYVCACVRVYEHACVHVRVRNYACAHLCACGLM